MKTHINPKVKYYYEEIIRLTSCNELFNSTINKSIFKSYVTCYTLSRIWTSLVSKWANCIKIECCSRLHPTHASKDCSRSEPGGRIQFNHCRAIDLKISGLIQFGFARFQGKQNFFLRLIQIHRINATLDWKRCIVINQLHNFIDNNGIIYSDD